MFSFGQEGGSEIERKLNNLLKDDTCQVISSFELNQIASLTYHDGSVSIGEDLTDVIFDILLAVLSKPAAYSRFTLQKSLVVADHVLLFGAEKVIQTAMILGRHVEALQNYNTILMAQQQPGAVGMLVRMKGGGVDKGGPVREAAAKVYAHLCNRQALLLERARNADPGSLVPVGDQNQVGFATDEMRLFKLRQKMKEQNEIRIKSNLVKAEGGFGAGYNSRDGKAVVGAAHGIEEMLKIAKREQKPKFTDDVNGRSEQTGYAAPQFEDFQNDLVAEAASEVTSGNVGDLLGAPSAQVQAQTQPQVGDLLDFSGGGPSTSVVAGAPTTSSGLLLGHAAETTSSLLSMQSPAAVSVDPFAPAPCGDLLGTAQVAASPHLPLSSMGTMDLLGSGGSGGNPPTQSMLSSPSPANTSDLLSMMSLSGDNPTAALGGTRTKTASTEARQSLPQPTPEPKDPGPSLAAMREQPKSIMIGSGGDRFAALDALATAGSKGPTAAGMAESRILGGGGQNNSSGEARSSNLPELNSLAASKRATMTSSKEAEDRILGLGGLAPGTGIPRAPESSNSANPPAWTPMGQPAVPHYSNTLKVSAQLVPPQQDVEGGDDENGFVMGGTEGAGLEPVGQAPAAPPPPPPGSAAPPATPASAFW